MNRTQKNIQKYKGMLPGLKEKLAAAAMLFAMTAAMLVTSTFAWLTLSYNPQVSDVYTSIASNGNLEIALANGTVSQAVEPDSSKVGDSLLETVARNLTWGNLINLNDSSYGLKNLVLRPALLNDTNLIERPLYGPVYDSTGRVVDMNTNFGYSTWDTLASRFSASENLGVRAITSMTYATSGEQNYYTAQLNLVEAANARFQSKYHAMAQNSDYMDALASMMTGYMVQNILKVNSSVGNMVDDATLKKSDLTQLAKMYETLIDLFEDQAEVYATFLNLQAIVNGKSDLKITAEEILALQYNTTSKTAYNALLEKGFTTYSNSVSTVGFIKDMDNFLYDYAVLEADLIRINGLISSMSGSSVSWPNSPTVDGSDTRIIDDIINNLTNVGECTITGGEYTNLKIKNVGATVALALKDAGVCETKITNGILYNVDSRSGARIKNPEGQPLKLSVSVSLMGTQTIQSNVSTSATSNYFENERALLASTIKSKYGAPQQIAKDSYGFAVDFWVRTNAANSFLTLQGNVLTRTDTVDVKGKDMNGNEVQLYTISVSVQSSEEDEENGSDSSILESLLTVSYDVYYSTYTNEQNETEDCLRFADSHQIVTAEGLGVDELPEPRKKVQEVETVIGYEGENRVWSGEEHSLLTVSSTTQGSGSCYVFYADTPVDQQRSLELLKSLKVAFVDENGELLTTAYMDTESHYATAGKVIVPMVLDNSSSINLGADDNGEIRYAITALEQNVAKRITAIVYLDGENLTNENVLAAADIQGQMNIQFGSSAVLVPINNEQLYLSEFYAEVESITPDEFDYDTLTEGEQMTSNVKVKVTGTQPNTMTASFIRRINDTQGSPEESFTLTDTDGDGIWEGSYTFLYPGDYILRSVVVDGVERDLKIEEGQDYPSVVVTGFTIQSVTYSINEFVMTDADSHTGTVTLKFASNDVEKMPSTVIGQFIREDGAVVNVNFAYNPTEASWIGTANFVSSGEYTMQYVVLDGQYVELAETMQKTVDLTLGMKVNVETTSPTTIFYGDEGAPSSLKIQVEILNNNNKIVENLAGAELVYKMTETEVLYAQLVYNSGEGYYEGEFDVEAGTWKFGYVTVRIGDTSTNNLYKANSDAPVFTVIPPTPPSFVANAADQAQYVSTNGAANFTATLSESGSATVYAKLVNDNGKVLYTVGSLVSSSNGDYSYIFNINESGLWTVESVSAFAVFDEDSNYHAIPSEINDETYETGIVFDASNSAFVETEIAVLFEKDITVTYDFANASSNVNANNGIVIFGKDADGTVTGTFMEEHTLENVTVHITDSNDLIKEGYFDISNVSLTYKYGSQTDASGNSYGGYTGGAYTKGTVSHTLNFAGSGTTFTLSNAPTFSYAAQYVPGEFTYTVTSNRNANVGNTVKVSEPDVYKIEVYSLVPDVYISSISPTGSIAVCSSYKSGCTGIQHTHTNETVTQVSNSRDVTVYYDCDGGTIKVDMVQPSVVITLVNGGNSSETTLVFASQNSGDTAVRLYSSKGGLTSTNSYVWSASDTTCTRWLGLHKTLGNHTKDTAGTLKASALLLTDAAGNEYTVDIEDIYIRNPN